MPGIYPLYMGRTWKRSSWNLAVHRQPQCKTQSYIYTLDTGRNGLDPVLCMPHPTTPSVLTPQVATEPTLAPDIATAETLEACRRQCAWYKIYIYCMGRVHVQIYIYTCVMTWPTVYNGWSSSDIYDFDVAFKLPNGSQVYRLIMFMRV